jgi:hypothetical protein
MVVCADQFFNETVQHADIVLPVTTFEPWSVDVYPLLVNDLPLSRCTSAKATGNRRFSPINKMEGSCTFPQEFNQKMAGSGIQRRAGQTVWHPPGMICWMARKKPAERPGDRKFKTPESMSSDQNAVRKWPYGAAGIQAEAKSVAIPSVYTASAVRPAFPICQP